MVKYYENGPLPTWIGWYAQQLLPRGFHIGAALTTLALELVGPFALFLPRRWRARAFVLFTLFQLGIIATANYAFLNHLVLLLGVSLACDDPPAKSPPWRERLAWVGFGSYALVTALGFVGTGVLRWPARLLEPFRIGENYGLFAVMTRARYEIAAGPVRRARHLRALAAALRVGEAGDRRVVAARRNRALRAARPVICRRDEPNPSPIPS